VAVHIPEHNIPAFKPAKEFVAEVKKLTSVQ
jgi:DNA-binding protein HU-beta